MYILIWQSVIWRPGKKRVPHGHDEPDTYPVDRDCQTARSRKGRALAGVVTPVGLAPPGVTTPATPILIVVLVPS